MSTAGEQPATAASDSAPPPDAHAMEAALKRMQQTFKELSEYTQYYAELHWDKLKLKLVQYALLAVLGLTLAVLVATLLIAGGIVLVIGLSYSLAEWLFDGNGAYGLLTAGAIFVLPILLLLGLGTLIVRSRFRAELGKKYKTKKQEQRARYGHDVEQRAAIA